MLEDILLKQKLCFRKDDIIKEEHEVPVLRKFGSFLLSDMGNEQELS